ncbi:3'-5' exonuclease [Ferrovibrio sp.]|uniref:3'-5' exonuclease n=1 Tax=Ferrovibrio sp. TaxID=1917215 RepID=UPI000CA73427|nr:3'-5' exonuclease [Ferrovibrio sp.]PJI40168.1 MAG: exonuclease [Ferrovibrio sp.]
MHEQIQLPSLAETLGATAIALDFETASGTPGSICAIGLAWIKDGQVSHVAHRLVRPHDMRFLPSFIGIHGIYPYHVEHEPEFPAIWDELLPHLEAVPLLLAHNAPFDIGVLRAALRHYGQPWPTLSYLCTVKIARAAWPDLATGHGLSSVAAHLGLELRHHAADSDAAACAGIALRAATEAGVTDIMEALPRWSIKAGRLEPDYHEGCTTLRDRAGARSRARIPRWLRQI